MNGEELDHVTVLTAMGDQYTFENVIDSGYDNEKDTFIIKSSDGIVNWLPRESVVIFATVPKKAVSPDEYETPVNDEKIITLLDRTPHTT